MKFFLCHKNDMWLDTWTYGDWRQYICWRPNQQTQCARIAILPYMLSMMAVFFLICSIFLMIFSPPELIAWKQTVLFVVINLIIAASTFIVNFLGWNIMMAVGPLQQNGVREFI